MGRPGDTDFNLLKELVDNTEKSYQRARDSYTDLLEAPDSRFEAARQDVNVHLQLLAGVAQQVMNVANDMRRNRF